MSTPITPTIASFEITDVGLAAASVAKPDGPYIQIVEFVIGDGFGYTPQRTDTGINGNVVFTGVPTSYNVVAPDTLDILCQLPPNAGFFEFGEVALMLPGGVMFAKAVFEKPQQKYPAQTSASVNTYSLHCLLTLKQAVAIIQVTVQENPSALNVFSWSDVVPASTMANPNIPMLIVHELSGLTSNDSAVVGEPTIMTQASATQWAVGGTGYFRYSPAGTNATQFAVQASNANWIEVKASDCHPFDLTNTANRRFLVGTEAGYYRSVSSVVVSGANYRFNLNTTNDGTYNNSPLPVVPAVGSFIRIYRCDQTGGSIYFDQIVDAPGVATVGKPGLAFGGAGTSMPGGGVIEAFGILQAPSANAGRSLTSADDLNRTNWPSGLYTISSASLGFPANMPVQADGHIWMHSEDPQAWRDGSNSINITQIYYPAGLGGGDSRGRGGLPPYWREWNANAPTGNGQGGWTDWFAFVVSGKNGGGQSAAAQDTLPLGGSGANVQALVDIPGAGTWNVMGWGKGMVNVYGGAQLLINGVTVDQTRAYGDTEGIGFNTMWGVQSITVGGPTQVQVVMLTQGAGSLGDFRVLGVAVPG